MTILFLSRRNSCILDWGHCMKGMIFTEFLEMAESRHSAEYVDAVIQEAAVPNDGAYTAVGTYPAAEMGCLLTAYSRRSGLAPSAILKSFGEHLYGRFREQYPAFFSAAPEPLAFLESVDGYIHVEVRKLYPDAELPTFQCHRPTPDSLVMLYQSSRGLADLAEGLIRACLAGAGAPHLLEREDLSGGNGTTVRFTLRPPLHD